MRHEKNHSLKREDIKFSSIFRLHFTPAPLCSFPFQSRARDSKSRFVVRSDGRTVDRSVTDYEERTAYGDRPRCFPNAFFTRQAFRWSDEDCLIRVAGTPFGHSFPSFQNRAIKRSQHLVDAIELDHVIVLFFANNPSRYYDCLEITQPQSSPSIVYT